jgi:hypothetical protein
MDHDGDIDILGGQKPLSVSWWENDGSENFAVHLIDEKVNSISTLYPVDLDNDGDTDVLASAHSLQQIYWWENDGNLNFSEKLMRIPHNGERLQFVDFDDDGDNDVFVVDVGGKDISWLENDGQQYFKAHALLELARDITDAKAIDLDLDGDLDILVDAWHTYWFEHTGNGQFSQHEIVNIDYPGSEIEEIADVDNDGDLDILSSHFWHENDGYQNFSYHRADDLNLMYRFELIDLVDFDFDGDYDVLGHSLSKLTWFENDGSMHFVPHPMSDTRYNDISAVDMDRDGDLDIVTWIWKGSVLNWLQQQNAPAPFILFKPYNNSTVMDTEILFSWYPSQDTDQDSIEYNFYLAGAHSDTIITELRHPNFVFEGEDWFELNQTYSWYVEAIDGYDTTRCLEKFHFKIPDQEILSNSDKYYLASNYPNPFNESTTFSFNIPQPCFVQLAIYNPFGQKVAELVNENLIAGYYQILWLPEDISSGLYIYQLRTNHFNHCKKCMFLK